MNIVTLDFETYYDDDYSLKKLTTEAYVRDPRFEVSGVGLGSPWSNGTLGCQWFTGDEIKEAFAKLDWQNIAVLCHHAQFDGFILSHHYGIKPRLWLDTLSMARLVVGNHLSVALDSLAKHYNLAGKQIDYKVFKGKHWHELTAGEQSHLASGCLHDVELTWRLFNILTEGFPDEELRVIDLTVRMFTEPVLRGDIELLGKVWMDERLRKTAALRELGVTDKDLQSNERFADCLRAEEIEPPLKESAKTPGGIYAFAKTDEFMKELIEDDTRAGALARARLGVRSTLNQTRAERLGYMATRGALPVYLRYSGAHTTRWSGGDSLNWQNFPRGGDIRKAIKAPEGGALIVLDLAQIECRILNLLAGQTDVVEAFRDGRDLYSETASRFYGREITRAHPLERHIGKVLELGCGYGMGADKLRATCRAGALGGPPIALGEAEAEDGIRAYRTGHLAVVAYWQTASRMISRLAGGEPLEWGPMLIKGGRLYLPNGAWLDYTTLESHYDDNARHSWRIKSRQGWVKLYGGKLVENVVQALARVVLSQAMLRIAAKGYKIAICTHDEIVVAIGADEIPEYAFLDCKDEMEEPPAWLPDLPLKVEGGVSERYEK